MSPGNVARDLSVKSVAGLSPQPEPSPQPSRVTCRAESTTDRVHSRADDEPKTNHSKSGLGLPSIVALVMVIDKSWTLLERHEKAFYTGLMKFVDDCKPYIPPNNEQNEPTQGDIGETSNEPTQAKRNEFEELYASANEELYPGCDYVTRLDFMAKFTYFKVN
ncbi:hypothetical protein Tco_1074298 [Tanacetum coccineum]